LPSKKFESIVQSRTTFKGIAIKCRKWSGSNRKKDKEIFREIFASLLSQAPHSSPAGNLLLGVSVQRATTSPKVLIEGI